MTALSSPNIRHSTYAIVGHKKHVPDLQLITINGDNEGLLNNALKLLHDSALRKSLDVNAKQLLTEVFSVQAAANNILAAMKRVV